MKDGANIITVHATGGIEMVRQAVEAVGDRPCLIAAVTVLTSFTSDDLWISYGSKERPPVFKLFRDVAYQSGGHALVCSAADLREHSSLGFFTIIPGIRPHNYQVPNDDQQMTTSAALLPPGVDLLVVGRPITQANEPVEALEHLMGELHE